MRKQTPQLFGYSIVHPINIILIANLLVFLIQGFDHLTISYVFGLRPVDVLQGKVWQLFTYSFLHAREGLIPFHLLFNMYGFFMLASAIEPLIGKWRVVFVYFASVLGGSLLVILFSLINANLDTNLPFLDDPDGLTIGASGAVFGLLAIFGLLYPEMEIYLLFFRIRASNAVIISLAIGYLMVIFFQTPISNTCHLGGALVGILYYSVFLRRNSNLEYRAKHLATRMANLAKSTLEKRIQEGNPNESQKVPPTATPETLSSFSSSKRELDSMFDHQISSNKSLLSRLSHANSSASKISILEPLQVSDANICPPSTYNPEDSFCLRCEWLPNCALRKTKTEKS